VFQCNGKWHLASWTTVLFWSFFVIQNKLPNNSGVITRLYYLSMVRHRPPFSVPCYILGCNLGKDKIQIPISSLLLSHGPNKWVRRPQLHTHTHTHTHLIRYMTQGDPSHINFSSSHLTVSKCMDSKAASTQRTQLRPLCNYIYRVSPYKYSALC
jgi:hypothetical protein